MEISFVGGGVMAEALIGGVIEGHITPADRIRVSEPVEARRQYLEETYGLKSYSSNQDVMPGADLVVLAFKPQTLPYVDPEMNGAMGE